MSSKTSSQVKQKWHLLIATKNIFPDLGVRENQFFFFAAYWSNELCRQLQMMESKEYGY